jgi:molybdopterin molybdotransferase
MELKEAREMAVGLAAKPVPETVELGRATGRVLAESVRTLFDMPANPLSRWDGFALSSSECAQATAERSVILPIAREETTAGKIPPKAARGTCVRIMTGGVLPAGMDAVVPFEDAKRCEKGLIFTGPVPAGAGVIPPGSEARNNDILLREGDVLTPTRIGVAAAAGRQSIRVARPPRVAILATGDELRGSGRGDESVSIFCNNSLLLACLVRVAGGEPVELGVAPDDPGVIYSRLQNVPADLVITTGGMGRGSKDFISEVWAKLGLEIRFDRLNIVPGKGSGLATGDGRIFLGLPGTPGAARIIFEEIGAPVIRSFLGLNFPPDFALEAVAMRPMEKREGFYRALDGVLEMRESLCAFLPDRPQSGRRPPMMSSFGNNPAYALLPPGDSPVAEGQKVSIKIPDLPLASWALLISGDSAARGAV